jgi:hypothetical protein
LEIVMTKKTYEILTPIQTTAGKKPQMEGIIELDSEDGDELVKLGALRPVFGQVDADDTEEVSLEDLAVEMLGKMTVKQLTAIAVNAEVVLPEKATKAQIIEALEAHRADAAADAGQAKE